MPDLRKPRGFCICPNSAWVRVFSCLLSGRFCCLGFSGVMFFAVWTGACFIFLLSERGRVSRPNSKKKRPPPKQQKKKHAPAPSERVSFWLLFGRVGAFFFFCLGGGACFFLAVWAGSCFFFVVWARGARFLCFALWAGARFCFLLFGHGTGVHSLTGLPGSSLSEPTTKKTKQQKTNTGSQQHGNQ